MIDFSKAPEGATHYDDSTKNTTWLKYGTFGWVMWDGYFNGVPTWVGLMDCDSSFKEIPKGNKMLIQCKTEREQMLCEQVLRMCRGEKSQFKSGTNGEWVDKFAPAISVDTEYRAKPKKELVVPWEFIPDCIDEITVSADGNVTYSVYSLMLKLDLTDIYLPVTVKRPSGEK